MLQGTAGRDSTPLEPVGHPSRTPGGQRPPSSTYMGAPKLVARRTTTGSFPELYLPASGPDALTGAGGPEPPGGVRGRSHPPPTPDHLPGIIRVVRLKLSPGAVEQGTMKHPLPCQGNPEARDSWSGATGASSGISPMRGHTVYSCRCGDLRPPPHGRGHEHPLPLRRRWWVRTTWGSRDPARSRRAAQLDRGSGHSGRM